MLLPGPAAIGVTRLHGTRQALQPAQILHLPEAIWIVKEHVQLFVVKELVRPRARGELRERLLAEFLSVVPRRSSRANTNNRGVNGVKMRVLAHDTEAAAMWPLCAAPPSNYRPAALYER